MRQPVSRARAALAVVLAATLVSGSAALAVQAGLSGTGDRTTTASPSHHKDEHPDDPPRRPDGPPPGHDRRAEVRSERAGKEKPDPRPIVAVIDSGIRATHQEFDYRGPDSTSDQLVAWWDFSADRKSRIEHPRRGQTWDRSVAPYDIADFNRDGNQNDGGHGTGVASLAVGRNAAPDYLKQPSFAPGYPLAVAKVFDVADPSRRNKPRTTVDEIEAAIYWATDTVGAKVINLSLGVYLLGIAPVPGDIETLTEATCYARDRGVTVVVANGNGWLNAGIPGEPGWGSAPSSSPCVIAVGADGFNSFRTSTDPEVVARYASVPMASHLSDSHYRNDASGTSFSAPLVAGMAARTIWEARLAGHHLDPVRAETLLKYAARDRPEVPPSFEGYGVLDAAQVRLAIAHARRGVLPNRPSPDLSAFYVESVAGGARDTWSGGAERAALRLKRTDAGGTGLGVIGPSAPTGVGEAEAYTVRVGGTRTVDLLLTYPVAPTIEGAVPDLDLYVFRGDGAEFDYSQLVARSVKPAGQRERVQFLAEPGVVYTVVVLGWAVTEDTRFGLHSDASIEFAGDGVAVHTFGIAG